MKVFALAISILLAVSMLAAQSTAVPVPTVPAASPPGTVVVAAPLLWPDEMIVVFGGHDQSAGGFAGGALLKKTTMFNGSPLFPTYSYTEILAERTNGKFTDTVLTGLVLPFYDALGLPIPGGTTHVLKSLRFTLAVGGAIGAGVNGSTTGFVMGAPVFLRVSKPASRFGFEAGGDPAKSTGNIGIHADRWHIGATYSFGAMN